MIKRLNCQYREGKPELFTAEAVPIYDSQFMRAIQFATAVFLGFAIPTAIVWAPDGSATVLEALIPYSIVAGFLVIAMRSRGLASSLVSAGMVWHAYLIHVKGKPTGVWLALLAAAIFALLAWSFFRQDRAKGPLPETEPTGPRTLKE